MTNDDKMLRANYYRNGALSNELIAWSAERAGLVRVEERFRTDMEVHYLVITPVLGELRVSFAQAKALAELLHEWIAAHPTD